MNKLTVVIPAYRGAARIRACLLDSRSVALRVVVFDNASVDGTRDIVRDEFPDVEIIVSTENVGFARADSRVVCRRRQLERDLSPDLRTRRETGIGDEPYHPVGSLKRRALSADGVRE